MKYMGSKSRYAKYLLPIMLAGRKDGQWWVEPFVGGGNMIDKVNGLRLGSDSDRYVIDALRDIRDNISLLPKDSTEFTEHDYSLLRHNDNIFKGYLGYALSYAGKWLGGWRRGNATDGSTRDYVKEAYNNAVKQHPKLQGIRLLCDSYDELDIPSNSIIYCDPPYNNTTKYKGGFDSDKFWYWCRSMSSKGHTVFVSEYNAPDDFECIWSKQVASSLTKDTGSKKSVEKLFKIKGK